VPTLGPAIRKVVKRDTGLTIDPDVQLAGDADTEEAEATGAAAAAPPAVAGAQAAPAPGPAAELNLWPWQTARQQAVNDLKALAAKVAGTKHADAASVLIAENDCRWLRAKELGPCKTPAIIPIDGARVSAVAGDGLPDSGASRRPAARGWQRPLVFPVLKESSHVSHLVPYPNRPEVPRRGGCKQS
jgi:hypothetical protein